MIVARDLITKLFSGLLLLLLISPQVSGQQNRQMNHPATCLTDSVHQHLLHSDGQYAKNVRQSEDEIYRILTKQRTTPTPNSYRSNAGNCNPDQETWSIPVVVHIVHRTGIPVGTAENLTDSQITDVIELTNNLYAHTGGATFPNPFSGTDVGIQLCLAARDESGNPTGGIVRHESNSLSTNNFTTYNTQNALYWNTTQYLNIYIVYDITGATASGYSSLASAHGQTYDGVVIKYDSWWEKLLAHETGHYFNLYHTFEGGCPNNNCLTDGDRVCDTPPKGVAGGTFFPTCTPSNSCPSTDDDDTSVNNPFRPVALGGLGNQNDSNENYMDYSGGCWAAFTQAQRSRMRASLNSIRSSLLNTETCMPFASDNAGIQNIVFPVSWVCNTTFAPVVTLVNAGTNSLTSATISVETNEVLQYNFPWTGSLLPGAALELVLPEITVPSGEHTLTVYTLQPNGNTDAYPANDEKCMLFAYQSPVTDLPFCNDLENGVLPEIWQYQNQDGQVTFDAYLLNNCAQNGNYVLRYNSFGYNIGNNGTTDRFLLPPVDLGSYESALLSFDRAYIQTFANLITTLTVEVSTDCGLTYTTVYQAAESALASVAGTETTSWQPSGCSQWAAQNIDLTPYTGQIVVIRFGVTLSGVYGQNLYLDNICITGVPACPPPPPTISPLSAQICSGGSSLLTASAIPSGFDQYNYRWFLNGNLLVGAVQQTYTATEPGNYTVQLFSETCPEVISATTVLSLYQNGVLPYSNTFSAGTGTGNFTVQNPNQGSIGWASGSSSCNGVSALFSNFNQNFTGQEDYLVSPLFNLSNFASITLGFDIAYAAYSPVQFDALRVEVSTNCGQSFTTVYSKSGSTLATSPNLTTSFTPANCSYWRSETVDLSSFNSAEVIFRFVNVNGNGNNLYLDNISLNVTLPCTIPPAPVVTPATAQICAGGSALLTASAIPSGFEQFGYRWLLNGNLLNGATQQTYTATIPGNYTVQLFSENCPPVSSDISSLSQYQAAGLPYSNNFSGGINSGNFTVQNPDPGSMEWASGSTSCHGISAMFANFNQNDTGQEDYLVSPLYNLSAYTALSLSFDIAYAAYSSVQFDALRVEVSTNCGQTFTSVYSKSGSTLATAPNSTTAFIPANCSLWRTETVDLSSYAGSQILLRFVNLNGNGNNLYLDNISLNGVLSNNGTRAYARLWLEGPYNSANISMFTQLSENGWIPNLQPFNRWPWWYAGTEQTLSIPANTVDWILLEALDISYNIVARRAALLRNDGYIIETDGTEGALFTQGVVSGNAYRLRVVHRNHISVVSAALASLPNTGSPYPFTLPAFVVGGQHQLTLTPNLTFALRCADAHPNGIINYMDYAPVFQFWGGVNGYYDGDFNLDGQVNITDFNLYRQNAGAIGVWQVRY